MMNNVPGGKKLRTSNVAQKIIDKCWMFRIYYSKLVCIEGKNTAKESY